MSLPSTLLRAREDLSENVIHKDNSHKNSMILDTIVARKKEEVAALKQQGIRPPESEKPLDSPRGFMQALVDVPGVAIIAEATPSWYIGTIAPL